MSARVRVLETNTTVLVHQRLRWLTWIATVIATSSDPTLCVGIGLPWWSWLGCGMVHAFVWVRVRMILGAERYGYRVRLRIW